MKTVKTKLIQAVERVNEINEAKRQVSKLDSELKSLKAYILSEMKGKRTLEAGDYFAKVTEAPRRYLDDEKLLKAGINIEDYKTPRMIQSLSITLK